MRKQIKRILSVLIIIITIYIIVKIIIGKNESNAIEISSIGVAMVENGETLEYQGGELFTKALGKFIPGKIYQENIAVRNIGEIDEYTRVTIYKYFLDKDGDKNLELSPELINLDIGEAGWIVDETASTPERLVIYYAHPVETGTITPPAIESIQILPEVSNVYTISKNDDGNGNYIIATTPKYGEYSIVLNVNIDVVQVNNAKDSIKSAWGVDVDVAEDGTITLK